MDFRNFMHAVVVTDMRLFYVRSGTRRELASGGGTDDFPRMEGDESLEEWRPIFYWELYLSSG